MKLNHLMKLTALLAVLGIGQPLPVFADEHHDDEEHHEEEHFDYEEDEEEVPFPTKEQTLAFLKEKVPVAVVILDLVRDEEGEEGYAEILEDFREQYHEYLEIERFDGPEAAGLSLEGARIELQLDEALHRYHEVAETDEDRAVQEARVRELVGQQLAHAKRAVEMELNLLREHQAAVEAELQELNAIGEEELNAEVAELLELDGEEDEEDEEEEVEDEE